MSSWAMSTADDRVQSSMTLDSNTRLSSIDMWIGSRVRIKRTSRGMTQQELSQLLDIDGDKLAAYEAGEERINANLLFRITKLLDVRPDYFFRGYVEERV
jgi:ribosome-binding protein aMBF1 (putative translation factor)